MVRFLVKGHVVVGAECPSHKIKIATPRHFRKGSGESFFAPGA
jgi:hypothetical protein